MSPAFSDKALQAQEPVLHHYVDIFIEKLRGQCRGDAGGVVDMAKWFNFTTFDLIGDLSFGQPFGLLEGGVWHRYVSTLFGSVKVFTYVRVILDVFPSPVRELLLLLLLPKKLMDDQKYQIELAEEKLKQRIETDSDREDFGISQTPTYWSAC
jgi:cytochrome P450